VNTKGEGSPSNSQAARKPGRKWQLYFLSSSFNRRVSGSHIQSGRTGEEQKELPLTTTQPTSLGCPARGLVTTGNRNANMTQK